jgi:hypothetical protein
MKVRPSEIVWPARIRTDFGDLEDLRKSIAEDRLGSPVTITKDKVLVDGGRRLKAWQFQHGDKPIECFVYEGSLDPIVMEIKMEALVKKFSPDEIYAAGKVLEEHYRPIKAARQKTGGIPQGDNGPKVPEGKTDELVAKDLGIDHKTYRRTKRLFEPEAEEKVGKPKAEELRQMARERGVRPAYEALKDQEYRQKIKDKPKPRVPEIVLSANESEYLYRLRRAIGWIKNPPNPISEDGFKEIQKVLTEMKAAIEEAINA